MDRPPLLRVPTDDIERSAEPQYQDPTYQDPTSRPHGLDSPGSGYLPDSEGSSHDPSNGKISPTQAFTASLCAAKS